MTLTQAAAKRLGIRAARYAEDHSSHTTSGKAIVADTDGSTAGIVRSMTRQYGPAYTRDRGEIAYWDIPASDYEAEMECHGQ